MKASEAERIAEEFSIVGSTTHGRLNRARTGRGAQTGPATASTPKRPVAVMSRSHWPLPAPTSNTKNTESDTVRGQRRQSQREAIDLSQIDVEVLAALHIRCKQLGIKIKKTKLLTVALQLLSETPTGKLLAVLGPHESTNHLLKPRKKKAPIRE